MRGIQGNKTETTNVIARYEVFTVLLFKIHDFWASHQAD